MGDQEFWRRFATEEAWAVTGLPGPGDEGNSKEILKIPKTPLQRGS